MPTFVHFTPARIANSITAAHDAILDPQVLPLGPVCGLAIRGVLVELLEVDPAQACGPCRRWSQLAARVLQLSHSCLRPALTSDKPAGVYGTLHLGGQAHQLPCGLSDVRALTRDGAALACATSTCSLTALYASPRGARTCGATAHHVRAGAGDAPATARPLGAARVAH